MPRAPKYPYVVRRELASGAIRYQASRRLETGRSWGPLRATAKEAHDDALAMQPKEPGVTRKGPLTFQQAIDLVKEELVAKRSAGTVSWFDSHTRALLLAFKPNAMLSKIASAHIELYIRKIGEKVSAATVGHRLRALSRIFRFCIRKGWLTVNPLLAVDKPTVKVRAMDFFAPAEVVALIGKVRASGHECAERDADLLSVTFLTGLRRAELARLHKDDVNLAAGVLHVRGKTGGRDVPLSQEAASLLRGCIARAGEDGLLFRGGVDGVARVFGRWQDNLNEPRLHAHALRHSFATELVRSRRPDGERNDVHTIAKLLGHKGLEMVMRYLHAHGDAARQAVNSLSITGEGSKPEPKVASIGSGRRSG